MVQADTPLVPVILVVENDVLVRTLAVDIFEEAGFEVVEAGDGEEAILALEARPDIRAVLTDVHMPGKLDGFGVARHVLEVRPECAVIVVSGRGDPHMPDLGPRVGFMPKPYRGEVLIRAIKAMLAS